MVPRGAAVALACGAAVAGHLVRGVALDGRERPVRVGLFDDADVVDGVPVRLDALQWALDVIAVWYGLGDWIDADAIRLKHEGGKLIWGADWDAFGGAPVLWPDDPGYEPVDDDSNDQVRRIVAAVLGKGRPGVAS